MKNDSLSEQLKFIQHQLDTEVELRLGLENQLQMAQLKAEECQEVAKKASAREEYFRQVALRYSKVVASVAPLLSDLENSPPITTDGFL